MGYVWLKDAKRWNMRCQWQFDAVAGMSFCDSVSGEEWLQLVMAESTKGSILPESNSSHLKIDRAPKEDSLPTTVFSGLMLVSGSVTNIKKIILDGLWKTKYSKIIYLRCWHSTSSSIGSFKQLCSKKAFPWLVFHHPKNAVPFSVSSSPVFTQRLCLACNCHVIPRLEAAINAAKKADEGKGVGPILGWGGELKARWWLLSKIFGIFTTI